MKVAFYTLGCKVNHYESEALQTLFKTEGYDIVDFKAYADIYVINTCTVTNTSDSKSRKTIRQAVKRNPDAVVAVIGCYAQVDSDTIASIDGVDIIQGTTDRAKLLDNIKRFLRERNPIQSIEDLSRYKTFDKLNVTSFEDQTRAFLKIQDGCNEFCSYCIIPFARGRIRSRKKAEVLKEATKLVNRGYKEIVLTGIHTGGYGSDLDDTSFYDLLNEMKTIEGLKRIRISSIEINQLSEAIITLIKDNDVFAKHLHIPLQHGSNPILTAMKRRYTVEAYLAKLESIRRELGDIAITTDIIVGYPGESEADFNAMKATIKAAKFSEMHIFPYSKRSGTKAAKMHNHIHGTIKSIRVNELMRLNEKLAIAYRQRKLKNQTPLHVLYEHCSDGVCKGHSSEYIFSEVHTNQSSNTFETVILSEESYPLSQATSIAK